jgi:hypothetical protein
MNRMAYLKTHDLLAAGLVAGGMAFAATPAALAGNVLELGYVVDVAGSTVLKANYRADIGGDSFEASLNGKTSGISNFFSGYKMNQSAAGKVVGADFIPGVFENDRKKKGKKAKSTDISWQADGGVMVARSGDMGPPPPAIAQVLGNSTSDPLTAILRMTHAQDAKPCSGKFRVYDGKDVYDLSLSFRKKIALTPATLGEGVECKLTWTPVAGNAVEHGDTDADSYTLSLAPMQLPSGRVMHVPLQIVGKTKGMTVTVSAASVTIDGQDVDAKISE